MKSMTIKIGHHVGGFKCFRGDNIIQLELAEGRTIEIKYETSDRVSIRTNDGTLLVIPRYSNEIWVAAKRF